jgi:hypothetical protein
MEVGTALLPALSKVKTLRKVTRDGVVFADKPLPTKGDRGDAVKEAAPVVTLLLLRDGVAGAANVEEEGARCCTLGLADATLPTATAPVVGVIDTLEASATSTTFSV